MENATPGQLTTSRLGPDETINTVRKLALSSYLKVRQAEDLRQDISSSLKFMGGPFHADDQVWYYQVDKNKIKRGSKMGSWIRAKVIRASSRSSMVVIDLGTRILQVNQSLLRRDIDTFSQVKIPIGDPATPDTPPPLASASSSGSGAGSKNSRLLQGGATAPEDLVTVEDGSASYAHVL